MPTLNVNGNIRVDTVANWTADVTVYSAKTILVSSDAFYGATDQRKFKIADGTQTWVQLDYMPIMDQTLAQTLANGNLTGGQWMFSDDTNSGLLIDDNGVYAIRASGDDLSEFLVSSTSASLGFSNAIISGYFVTDGTSLRLFHTNLIVLNAPNINLPNETASRYLFLDASKNIDTKTTAQVLSDIGAQPLDADLTTIAGLSPSTGDTLYYNAGWGLKSYQGYTFTTFIAGITPSDATTYYSGAFFGITTSTDGLVDLIIPKSGTIKRIDVIFTNNGTLGSAETSTVYFRINNTTDTTISSSVVTNATWGVFTNNALSTSVVAGDRIVGKWITPTWATNPTAVRFQLVVYIE